MLKLCPFCSGTVDPEGWLDGAGFRGPECNGCGATAPDMPTWNRRASEAELVAAKDEAYRERNQVVAVLASLFPAGIGRTDIPGWDPEWHGCVYIDLPTGQASWHYHDREAHLFAHLPPYDKPWDGHTTEEKYARLAALSKHGD